MCIYLDKGSLNMKIQYRKYQNFKSNLKATLLMYIIIYIKASITYCFKLEKKASFTWCIKLTNTIIT